MKNHVIIMAGGIGGRFWPLSTPNYPKQFIDVLGCGKSLIQLTVERYLSICPISHIWIVTNEKYVDLVRIQLPELPTDNILAEPVSRNTAPCIAYACWKIRVKYPDANIVVSPSDALIINTLEFQRVINKALNFTSIHEAIVTIGIHPNRPETGYGYIAIGKQITNDIYKVQDFKEKPNIQTAKAYLASNKYYWNSGIFIWNINTICNMIHTFQPTLALTMDKMKDAFYTNKEKIVVKKMFPTCENISIDYAIMEKAEDIYTVPAEFSWSDLGSWGSLHDYLKHDTNNNAILGSDIRLYECKNCIIHAPNESKVVVHGLENYIVAENHGCLLVYPIHEEQHIKEFSI